ncbi:MAG: DUF1295 domain-containing protein [Myxococcaceae bacterium]|nr:DUF1295 domain-containing protein [Myxococcaceae bacterium]
MDLEPLAMVALAVVTWLALTFITAPYGRHQRSGWGPMLPAKLAWPLMESPSFVGFALVLLVSGSPLEAGTVGPALLWLTHYAQRTVIYPLRMSPKAKPMPAAIAALAFGFNLFNVHLNAGWLLAHPRGAEWLLDPRFLAGAALFASGFGINLWADAVLFRLRAPGQSGYSIPRGGLYELVSCPNYLGELLEWLGYALAAWSPAGLAFAIYTAANLVPRARAHHRWYRETFDDYPAARRAVVPFLY